MIRIKYIPNRLLPNKDTLENEVVFDRDKTIAEYCKEQNINTTNCICILSGKVVTDFNTKINNNDEIIITPDIRGGGGGKGFLGFLLMLVGIPLIPFGVGIGLMYVGFGMLTSSFISSLTPRTPSMATSDGFDDNSPTYAWEGISTTQEVGIPLPIIYGRHRVGGNIINQYIRTDGDKQYLNMLIALGEGEINSISDILINDNPSANFSDIVTTLKYGTNDQTVIPNFQDLHNIYSIGSNLTKNNAYTYTTVDSDVEAFEVNLTLPNGIFQQDSGGSVLSWDVVYKVEYKLHADASYTDLGSTTVSAKSRTAVRRTFRKDGLTAGQYDIKITRTSDDSSLDPVKTGDLTLTSIDEIKTDDLAYPNTAVAGIEALATDQLSGSSPNLTFLIEGRKVSIPQILTVEGGTLVDWEDYYWDSTTSEWKLFSDDSVLYWDGTTYAEQWCANPVWCLKDLLLNSRYGLGEFIKSTQLSDTDLLTLAKYCEERLSDGDGGYEKRFRLDVVIDGADKALDTIVQLCATFRGAPFYANGVINLDIDRIKTVSQIFGMGNIIKDTLQQSWKSIKDVPNVIEVQFLDEDLDYKQETIAVIDETSIANGDPLRKTQIRLFVTKKSYAIREGRYFLWQAKYLNRSVIFRTGIDAIACSVGSRIGISHDVPQWGFSGRVQTGSTTTKVYLDQNVTIENAKTYKVMVRFADDTIEEKTVSNSAGTYNYLDVSSAFSNAPANYDIYSFGETNIEVKPFRIVSIKKENTGECEISAVEYNESVYDDTAPAIPTNNYSALSLTTSNVENLALTERLVKLSDGTIENCIDVWFNKPAISEKVLTYDKAKIYISDNAGASYEPVGETYGSSYSIVGNLIDGIEHKVVVVSVGFNGKSNALSTSPSSTIQLIGKSASPANITTFLVNQSRDRLTFGWSEVTDLDLSGYEIRYGATWETSPAVASGIKGNNFITLNFKTGNAQSFWIKAIDTSGNYSTTAKEATITVDNIPFTNVVESYSEQTAWGGTKSNTSKVGDNLEIDATYLTGTYVTAVRDVGYVATFKISVDAIVLISGDDTWQDFGELTFPELPDTLRFSGTEIVGATSFEIKTSEDNSTWSDWALWQAGDYKCRYFQLRLTLTRVSTAQDLECSAFDYYADLPDVDEFQDGEVETAGDGCDITFVKTLHENPAINVTILTGDGFVWKATGLDTTGVNIKLYELDGTAVTGTFRIHIHGV